MVNAPTPDPFEQRSRELFEESVGRLDARTRSRLNQARQRALDEVKKGAKRRYWLAAPLGGLAVAALIAVLLVNGRQPIPPAPESAALPLDDFDIVADADTFELIEDVEFYSWLAEAQGGGQRGDGSTG